MTLVNPLLELCRAGKMPTARESGGGRGGRDSGASARWFNWSDFDGGDLF